MFTLLKTTENYKCPNDNTLHMVEFGDVSPSTEFNIDKLIVIPCIIEIITRSYSNVIKMMNDMCVVFEDHCKPKSYKRLYEAMNVANDYIRELVKDEIVFAGYVEYVLNGSKPFNRNEVLNMLRNVVENILKLNSMVRIMYLNLSVVDIAMTSPYVKIRAEIEVINKFIPQVVHVMNMRCDMNSVEDAYRCLYEIFRDIGYEANYVVSTGFKDNKFVAEYNSMAEIYRTPEMFLNSECNKIYNRLGVRVK